MVHDQMCMPLERKRGALSIIESILQALREGPELKTNIAHKSRTDSRTIRRYLPLLVELRLVKPVAPAKYKITSKGVGFLEQYTKLKHYNSNSDFMP